MFDTATKFNSNQCINTIFQAQEKRHFLSLDILKIVTFRRQKKKKERERERGEKERERESVCEREKERDKFRETKKE